MPMLMRTIDEYLYTTKHDILILQLRQPDRSYFSNYDKNEETKQAEQEHIKWFKDRNIEMHHTCSTGTLGGWYGLYYIDINPTKELIDEHTAKFENPDGSSLKPVNYQMTLIEYQEWIDKGGIEEYEQHLRDMADPNYQY